MQNMQNKNQKLIVSKKRRKRRKRDKLLIRNIIIIISYAKIISRHRFVCLSLILTKTVLIILMMIVECSHGFESTKSN